MSITNPELKEFWLKVSPIIKKKIEDENFQCNPSKGSYGFDIYPGYQSELIQFKAIQTPEEKLLIIFYDHNVRAQIGKETLEIDINNPDEENQKRIIEYVSNWLKEIPKL